MSTTQPDVRRHLDASGKFYDVHVNFKNIGFFRAAPKGYDRRLTIMNGDLSEIIGAIWP